MSEGRRAWWLSAALPAVAGSLIAILLLGPFWLEVAIGDIDASWKAALHHGFASRWAWGRDPPRPMHSKRSGA